LCDKRVSGFENQFAQLELRIFDSAQQWAASLEQISPTIRAKQYWRAMAGIAVGQFSRTAVNPREKCRGERRNRPQIAEVAVDFRGDLCRVRIRTVVTLQKSRQIGEPHSSRNTLTGNVSVRHKDLGTA